MKFTPGPYVLTRKVEERGIPFICVGKPGYDVARVPCYGDNAEYNARLLSAAPEMYSWLKFLLDTYELDEHTRQNIKEVIRKAEGK